jgi:hypothetical protein
MGARHVPIVKHVTPAELAVIQKFIGLTNENVIDGHVTFVDVAKICRLLLFAKVHPDDVAGIRVGLAIYEKFHWRGIKNKLSAKTFER